jgi:hypothetical protein
LLCSSGLLLISTGCARKGVQENVTLDGRVTTDTNDLRQALPVDVLVLPVQNEVGELLPAEIIELKVREILLSKRYSVLSRELAFTRADSILSKAAGTQEPSWRDQIKGIKAAEASADQRGVAIARGWEPGAVGEDAFFRVIVHSFKIPPSGPIRQLEIDADFEFVSSASATAGKVLWSYRGARAVVPVDRIGDRMRSRQDNLETILHWYIESILEHLPESEGLHSGLGATLTG